MFKKHDQRTLIENHSCWKTKTRQKHHEREGADDSTSIKPLPTKFGTEH
jgi:hypothetical protein